LSGKTYDGQSEDTYAFRVCLDHLRAATFLVGDGIFPSNKDQGYYVRRLIRRSVRFAHRLGIANLFCKEVVSAFAQEYGDAYPNLSQKQTEIGDIIHKEEEKFRKTLREGIKQFEKGEDPFVLFSTYGFPIELTLELAKEKAIEIDLEDFNKKMLAHQDISRAGSEQKFKGGLADTSEQSVRYHTATHLLHYALRKVLGEHVQQKGSNITPERLRFDFAHPTKMTDEEKKKVEDIVNEKIQQAITVENKIMPKEEAVKIGALHFFNEKYPDQVSVYFIGDSIEFCGGPHVKNTKELGIFKIAKEEAVSAGVRRIKAVLS
jgi:alanyl-tRNA synthetase